MGDEQQRLILRVLLPVSLLACAACSSPKVAAPSTESVERQSTSAQLKTAVPEPPFNDVVPFGVEEGSVHTKRYTNFVYGYSVPVPKGLAAYSNQPHAPAHGAGIVLSKNPDAYLYVDGSYNAAFWASLDEAANVRLDWLKEDCPNAQVKRREMLELAELPALRSTVIYRTRDQSRLQDYVIAFRKIENDVTIVYTAALDTTEDRYTDDAAKLNEIVSGWKLTKAE